MSSSASSMRVTEPFRFSTGLVVAMVRHSDPLMPKRWSVSVSSSPSRREAAAPGWVRSRDFARRSNYRFANGALVRA